MSTTPIVERRKRSLEKHSKNLKVDISGENFDAIAILLLTGAERNEEGRKGGFEN